MQASDRGWRRGRRRPSTRAYRATAARQASGSSEMPRVEERETREGRDIVRDLRLVGDAPGFTETCAPVHLVVKAKIEQRVGTIRRRRARLGRQARDGRGCFLRHLQVAGALTVHRGKIQEPAIQLAQRGEWVRRKARLARPQNRILHVRLPTLLRRSTCISAQMRRLWLKKSAGMNANFVINFCQILLARISLESHAQRSRP